MVTEMWDESKPGVKEDAKAAQKNEAASYGDGENAGGGSGGGRQGVCFVYYILEWEKDFCSSANRRSSKAMALDEVTKGVKVQRKEVQILNAGALPT